MSKQEQIMKLLNAGKIIRLMDGRCENRFVDIPALQALINQGRVKVYDNKGVDFVRAYTYTEELAHAAEKVAKIKQAAQPFMHPDLQKILSGNTLGDDSIVFQRDNAALTIGDFRRLAEVLK